MEILFGEQLVLGGSTALSGTATNIIQTAQSSINGSATVVSDSWKYQLVKGSFVGSATVDLQKVIRIRNAGGTAEQATANILGSGSISAKQPVRIQHGKSSVMGQANIVAKQPVRIQPAESLTFANGSVTAKEPIRLRHTEDLGLEGAAQLVQNLDFVRLRAVENSTLYDGLGFVDIDADSWKWKTVRGNLIVETKLEAYIPEYRDIMRDIKDYVPKYYQDSPHVQSILSTKGNEFIRFNAKTNEVLLQFFPETATWGLDRWEFLFGIETDYSIDIETRREEVLERIRGFHFVNVDILNKQADKFWGTDITQDIPNLEVIFTISEKRALPASLDPKKYELFLKKMRALVPSHMEVFIKFTYTPWSELQEANVKNDLQWGDLQHQGPNKAMSWNKLMTTYFTGEGTRGPLLKWEVQATWSEFIASSLTWVNVPESWQAISLSASEQYDNVDVMTFDELEEMTFEEFDTRYYDKWEVKE
jgi:hypothetical protein